MAEGTEAEGKVNKARGLEAVLKGQGVNFFETADGALANGARFLPGDLVLQSWPWIGRVQVCYPYWQVCSVAWIEDRDAIGYLCEPLPRGAHPASAHWFGDKDLYALGRRFQVPDRELLRWSTSRSLRAPGSVGGDGPWAAAYHAALPRKRWEDNRPVDAPYLERRGPYPPFPPYEWERAIVEYLDALPLKWWDAYRSDYVAKAAAAFPERFRVLEYMSLGGPASRLEQIEGVVDPTPMAAVVEGGRPVGPPRQLSLF